MKRHLFPFVMFLSVAASPLFSAQEDRSSLQVDCITPPIDIELIDPSGHTCGRKGPDDKDIPNCAYSIDGSKDDETGHVDPESSEFIDLNQSPLKGTYRIHVVATRSGPYTIQINAFSRDGSPQSQVTIEGKIKSYKKLDIPFQFDPAPNSVHPEVTKNKTYKVTVEE